MYNSCMEQENNHENKVEKESYKLPSLNTPTAVLIGAIIIAIAIFTTFGNKQKTPTEKKIDSVSISDALKVSTDDHMRGDLAKAEVVFVEFSDSDCPFCQKFHDTMKQIFTESNGKMVWVYRHFPLNIHPNAEAEAFALECVASIGGADKFDKYLDEVITKTFQPVPNGMSPELVTIATNLGIDEKTFRSCVASPKIAKAVEADSLQAQGVGAQGTPFSIVVNLKTKKTATIPGAYPIEEVRKILADLAK